ncbi:hypothetical protein, conserved [Eimeria tenella]|uniref:Uncharacterized protein n=1 Tax=Eimeria tenella TaxID=5802 RepID=U6L628_EIMTE|nr:hypothetical protein, conserved [Eimeria tenella]CDJ44024.1 hypothetical protein, conserved [Eimeria tenella]|eukprot:XP_013234773.1 hypothetical protein, conserved [Eimeria tenella]
MASSSFSTSVYFSSSCAETCSETLHGKPRICCISLQLSAAATLSVYSQEESLDSRVSARRARPEVEFAAAAAAAAESAAISCGSGSPSSSPVASSTHATADGTLLTFYEPPSPKRPRRMHAASAAAAAFPAAAATAAAAEQRRCREPSQLKSPFGTSSGLFSEAEDSSSSAAAAAAAVCLYFDSSTRLWGVGTHDADGSIQLELVEDSGAAFLTSAALQQLQRSSSSSSYCCEGSALLLQAQPQLLLLPHKARVSRLLLPGVYISSKAVEGLELLSSSSSSGRSSLFQMLQPFTSTAAGSRLLLLVFLALLLQLLRANIRRPLDSEEEIQQRLDAVELLMTQQHSCARLKAALQGSAAAKAEQQMADRLSAAAKLHKELLTCLSIRSILSE